ncbi:hypothetical protein Rhal01_03704 [Rubritalea halochordaticola]|uniref:Uncharacterized protein n=1 Tax=Rubritalea halochordaticola TaxID=714537 RepID=A0ABP9V4B1_9BACT
MFKATSTLLIPLAFLLSSCEKPGTASGSAPAGEQASAGRPEEEMRFIAVMLHKLASHASAMAYKTGDLESHEAGYTRSLTIAYLNEIFEKEPGNFLIENYGVDSAKHYHAKDPLGWRQHLDEGCLVRVEDDPHFIVLYREFKPDERTAGRGMPLIVDAVPFSRMDLLPDGKFDYEKLGELVLREAQATIRITEDQLRKPNSGSKQ